MEDGRIEGRIERFWKDENKLRKMKKDVDGNQSREYPLRINQPHQAMQNYIDINSAFSSRETVAEMLKQARNEKERISREMNRAYDANRSDRKEWKIRHEALINIIRGLEYLSTQILITSGRTPLI